MKVLELTVLYVLVGVGCAVFTLRHKPATAKRDAPLMLLLWPVFLPFALADGGRHTSTDPGAASLLQALQTFADGPLASLLPGTRTVESISARILAAVDRIAKIDRLLASPELDVALLQRRLDAFKARGDETSAAAVAGRLAAVSRLKQLRERSDREVVQVRELLAQLAVQAEVVKLSGGGDAAVRGTVQELVARTEGLDSVLVSGELDGAFDAPRV